MIVLTVVQCSKLHGLLFRCVHGYLLARPEGAGICQLRGVPRRQISAVSECGFAVVDLQQ